MQVIEFLENTYVYQLIYLSIHRMEISLLNVSLQQQQRQFFVVLKKKKIFVDLWWFSFYKETTAIE